MARIGFADCKLQRQTFMEPELRRSQGIILPDCGKPIEGFPQTLIAQTAIFKCEPLHILEFNACGIVGLMSVNGMASPLVGPFARETMINENVFILATKKLFEWSKTQNCRFYAIVHDATGLLRPATNTCRKWCKEISTPSILRLNEGGHSSCAAAPLKAGIDAVGARGDFQRRYGASIGTIDSQVAGPFAFDGEPGNEPQWRLCTR
jgi:hypothetical protein